MKTLLRLLLFTCLIYFNEIKSQVLPDLWINAIKSNSQLYQPGQEIYGNYKLRNRGTANCPFSFSAFYLSTDSLKDNGDLLLGYDYKNSLKTGDSIYSSYSFSIPYSTAYGNYYLLFVSDFNTLVQEQSEVNNVSNFPIAIGPINADLIMQPLSPTPLVMVAGQSKPVDFEIRNNGLSTVRVDYLCVLSNDSVWSANDVEIYSTATNYHSLDQNSSVDVEINNTIPVNTLPGSYHLLYIVDYTNSVTETNELNNLKHYPVSVISQNADLAIISENVSPSCISSGGNCMVSIDVTNLGTTDVAKGVTEVFYYISKDTLFDNSDIGFYAYQSSSASYVPLNDSNTVHVNVIKNIATSIAPGNYYMLMIVDQYNSINETNNANNIGHYPITVTPPGTSSQINDVAVLSGNLTGAVLASGRTVSITSQVYFPNNPVGSYNYMRYILSADTIVDNNDISIGSENIHYSSPDTGFTASQIHLPQNLIAGAYYVIFDMGVIANDPVPQNNRKFQAVTILAPDYDLALNPKEISSTLLTPGSQFTLSVEAYNHSVGKLGYFQMAFYLSDDTILDNSDGRLSETYSTNYYHGSTHSTPTDVSYYLSSDSVLDNTDQYLKSVLIIT